MFWLSPGRARWTYIIDNNPVCWPFFSGCEGGYRLSPTLLSLIFVVYVLLAALSGLLFLSERGWRWAYWLLVIVTVIKFALYMTDYRLSGNYHYMQFWVLFGFLCLPEKSKTLRFLILGFYLGAAALKFNAEWLTGAAIPPFFIRSPWLEWSCIYVVVLESVLVFGLLSRRPLIFWGTLAQLALFHFISSFVVGYFYPLVFACFLTLFLLERYSPFQLSDLIRLPGLSQIFLGLFVLAQIVPFFLGGDRAVDGKGRLFALNMFDARVVCDFKMEAKFSDGRRIALPRLYSLEDRIYCDPNVLLYEVLNQCRSYRQDPEFIDIDVMAFSRRQTEAKMTELFNYKDYCQSPARVNLFGNISRRSNSN